MPGTVALVFVSSDFSFETAEVSLFRLGDDGLVYDLAGCVMAPGATDRAALIIAPWTLHDNVISGVSVDSPGPFELFARDLLVVRKADGRRFDITALALSCVITEAALQEGRVTCEIHAQVVLTLCVQDSMGSRIAGAQVQLSAPNWSPEVRMDANGEAHLLAPAGNYRAEILAVTERESEHTATSFFIEENDSGERVVVLTLSSPPRLG